MKRDTKTWLWQAVGMPNSSERGHKTQFILTSYSLSVLCEFSDYLDSVYTFYLDKKGFRSDVQNLNDFLEVLVDIGTLEGESIEKQNGEKIVKIPRYKLAALWLSGTIG